MKSFILLSTLVFLQSCSTLRPPDVFQAPPVCGKTLDKKYFVPCETPKPLNKEATYEEVLNNNAQNAALLKQCAINAKALSDVLKSCKSQ
jgi:hypothetical protein